MKRKLIILFSIIGVLILAGVIVLMPKNNKHKEVNVKESNKITLYTISQSDKVIVNGIISPEKVENITLDASKGNVFKVSVKNGQIVKKGDIIFTYKNDQTSEQIEQLNQQIASMKNQKNSLDTKQEEKINTDEGQIKTLLSQINSLKEKELINITAPIDGKVFLNDSKDQTKPFITIRSTSFIVKGVINEKDLIKVKQNQAADIFVYALDKTVTGKVKSVASEPGIPDDGLQTMITGNLSLSVYGIYISLDSQEGIVNGFHVQASVKLSGEVNIAKSSLLNENGKKYVFKVQDKKLVKQEIQCEESTSSSEVIVHTGLKENDTIVITPTLDMKEGNVIG